jgi:hypothetical protein
MRIIFYIALLFVICVEMMGQQQNQSLIGKVSFITPQNTYVRFKSTEGISAGDTLFVYSSGKLVPVLVVNNLSSASCVCTPVSSKTLSLSQDVLARKKPGTNLPVAKHEEIKSVTTSVKVISSDTVKIKTNNGELKQKISGSISAYSYSGFSNTSSKNSTQFRYNYTLNAKNIGNSRFSFENYITFRHKSGDWSSVKSNIFNALKIYTLAVRFEPTKSSRITLGRTFNYKISSLGAMDGLQLEKTFNKFSIGAVAGTRPDFRNYGFDSKLLQYGGYIALDTKSGESFSESSLAFMQQMNNMKTDRRFLYFQHSNSILRNIYFFSTFEVDLYTVKNALPKSTFDLTSIYLSLRLKVTKSFSLTGSYDQRKNVLYYETYKTLIDSVLENERRQSIRLQANYRIANNISLGIESGYRFLKSDPRPSKNINGYLNYYQVPALKISVTLTGTYLESAYMNGKVLGANISKDLFKGRLQTSLGYRYEDYTLPESKLAILQNIGEMSLFWQFSRKMSFSANYEGTFEKKNKYTRVYLQLRKRF